MSVYWFWIFLKDLTKITKDDSNLTHFFLQACSNRLWWNLNIEIIYTQVYVWWSLQPSWPFSALDPSSITSWVWFFYKLDWLKKDRKSQIKRIAGLQFLRKNNSAIFSQFRPKPLRKVESKDKQARLTLLIRGHWT